MNKPKTIGIAGLGAIGSAVGRALQNGIDGLQWTHASEITPNNEFDIPYVSFDELAQRCDIVVECLPADKVPELAEKTLKAQKTLIMISGCALLLFPEILDIHKQSTGSLIIPSGAIAGLDGIKALKELGIKKSVIASTKKPQGFSGAPYVDEMRIDLAQIKSKTKLFEGSAIDAAKGFPANVNVAASLCLAGIGPEKTQVQIWADPDTKATTHTLTVESTYSRLTLTMENTPDPANPKSSMLAARSIIAALKDINNRLVIL